jgi:hypothetical protein
MGFDHRQIGRRTGFEETAARVVFENTGIEKYRQSLAHETGLRSTSI